MREMADNWPDVDWDARDFVRRGALAELQAWWAGEPTEPLVIEGSRGMGKTLLLWAFANWLRYRLGDVSRIACVSLEPHGRCDEVAQALRGVQERSLLAVDGADCAAVPDLVDALGRMKRYAPRASVLVTAQRNPNESWPVLHLGPISDAESDILVRGTNDLLQAQDATRPVRASEGSPRVAKTLAHMTRDSPLDEVLARLGAQYFEGLLPSADLLPSDQLFPAGQEELPFRGAQEELAELEIRVCAISEALIKRLADNADLMYELRPRQLEELMAELYAREGFEVELTQQTHDGGVDLYLVRHTPFGRLLTIVDTKRNRRDRTVGVGVVRQLYGVVEAKRASAGVVATTSFFSPEAHRFQQSVPFRLGLQDYFDLQTMLRRAADKALPQDSPDATGRHTK